MRAIVCAGQMIVVALILLAAEARAESPAVGPDEVVLSNGSRIIGLVTGSRDGLVTIETDFAGTLTVELDKIDLLRSRTPSVVLLSNDAVLRDVPVHVEDGLLRDGTGNAYALSDLHVLNPEPWELGEGYRWSGLLDFALVIQRGNTESDELDYQLESVWRSTRDRYTLRFKGEDDENNGTKSADNWRFTGKYDYFLEDPNYWGVLAFAEQDKFADLDLRYQIGPYIGRQFYSEPIFSLSGEIGISYVDEDFIVAEDRDYPALNWAFDGSSDYLGGDSVLYLTQKGLYNLDDAEIIADTTFGLAFPLLWNFQAAAEIVFEYDSSAVEGVDDLDQTYKLRVGYTW